MSQNVQIRAETYAGYSLRGGNAGHAFAFTDLSKKNLKMVAQLCERDLEYEGLPAKISYSTDRREADHGFGLRRFLDPAGWAGDF